MTSDKICQIIDDSFDNAFSNWSKKIERHLYPDAFANENSWLKVKNSFYINNLFLKEALKESLIKILSDD